MNSTNSVKDKIGHFLASALTVLWAAIIVVVFQSIDNQALKWLWLVCSGFITFTVLVEGAQFESLVNEIMSNKIPFRKAVAIAFEKTWENTKEDIAWNFMGAMIGGSIIIALVM